MAVWNGSSRIELVSAVASGEQFGGEGLIITSYTMSSHIVHLPFLKLLKTLTIKLRCHMHLDSSPISLSHPPSSPSLSSPLPPPLSLSLSLSFSLPITNTCSNQYQILNTFTFHTVIMLSAFQSHCVPNSSVL